VIEVRIVENGARAEAATPEDAVYAAITIGREAKEQRGIQGFDPTVVFEVAGKIVRTSTLRSLARVY